MKIILVLCVYLTASHAAGIIGAEQEKSSHNVTANSTAIQRERTYIMIKPQGVQRGFIGEIIGRFEMKGFKLIALKFMKPSKELLIEHYRDIKIKSDFLTYIDYMLSGPVVGMVWEGENVIEIGRLMIGSPITKQSLPGTIRGDMGVSLGRNVIHGSRNVEDANREISMWFKVAELINWHSIIEDIV